MMKAMNDKELRYFILLILGVQTVTNYAGGFGIGLDQILEVWALLQGVSAKRGRGGTRIQTKHYKRRACLCLTVF